MRNYKRDLLTILLAAYGVGFIADAAYASVIFIGDANKVGFGAAKKVIPTVFDCPDGQAWYKGKCVKKCNKTAFPLTSEPDEVKGTFDTCTDVWGTYYVYKSCHNGWDLIEGNCTETDCTGFSYTKAPESIAGTVTSCKSGLMTYYKYLSCNAGWDLSNGKCNIHTCSSTTYPYTSSPSADAGTVIDCKTGVVMQYGYSDCRTGWDKSNGYCNIHTCDSNAFPFTSQPSSSIGTVVSCKTGNDVKYGYSACTPEYELKNGQCEIKCSYTATSMPTNCATATDSCVKNGTVYYSTACATCNNGYIVSSGSCVVNPCTGFYSSNTGCQSYTTCKSGTTNKYNCTKCKNGYYLSGNQCPANKCDGYIYSSFTTVSDGCSTTPDSCLSGTTTRYKCPSCYTGYDLDAIYGTCKKTCTYYYTAVKPNCARQDSCALGSAEGESMRYSGCRQCEDGYTTAHGYNGECYPIVQYYYYKGTIIGIIVKDLGSSKIIMALKNIDANGQPVSDYKSTQLAWATEKFKLSEAGLTNISKTDMDGEGNTAKVLAYAHAHNISVPAFEAVRKYAPSVCENGSICGVGKWYLPAAGETNTICGYRDGFSYACADVGGTHMMSSYFWTSTAGRADNHPCVPYNQGFSSCYPMDSSYCTASYPVRPFLRVTE